MVLKKNYSFSTFAKVFTQLIFTQALVASTSIFSVVVKYRRTKHIFQKPFFNRLSLFLSYAHIESSQSSNNDRAFPHSKCQILFSSQKFGDENFFFFFSKYLHFFQFYQSSTISVVDKKVNCTLYRKQPNYFLIKT